MIAINGFCTVSFTARVTASVELPEDVASVDELSDDEIVELLFSGRLGRGMAGLERESERFDVEIDEAYDGTDD